jgi:SH3 and multiple ankyrin repeat domains protein
MTVLTLPNLDHMEMNGNHPQLPSSLSSARQCATLPRRIHGPSKLPAPAPPRRDPRTTLSVGRARAKSMVAGLEGGGVDHDDDDELSNPTKSNSAESLHQQSQSAISTPTQGGPGTPVQPRTASIKARPTSSRITAAELEELFQRQQGADASRCSAMMTTSRFQSGLESGAATPPTSPQKGPLVYASVAEMKRKKSRNGNGTLKGRPIPIPTVSSDLRRNFHSTPDLATNLTGSSNSGTWNSAIFKNHRSQDDVNYLYNSMQRLNLPPPTHPPPPPPVGQVVKVEVSRGSEYESTLALQQKLLLQKKATAAQAAKSQILESEVMSSFRPAANAKLYASPQDIRNVGYRAPAQQQDPPQPQQTPPVGKNQVRMLCTIKGYIFELISFFYIFQVRKSSSVRSNNSSSTLTNTPPMSHNLNPYAQPGRPGLTMSHQQRYGNKGDMAILHAPPIPDPDYSLSESDGEGDNSVRLMKGSNVSVIEVNGGIGNNLIGGTPNPGMAIETSGNSNAR